MLFALCDTGGGEIFGVYRNEKNCIPDHKKQLTLDAFSDSKRSTKFLQECVFTKTFGGIIVLVKCYGSILTSDF